MSEHFTHTSRGFTLVETLVAAALIAGGVAALAHLIAVGVRQTTRGHDALFATVAAQSRLNALRAIVWTQLDDGLTPSPAQSLLENTDGFVDYPDAGYVRRWSISRPDPLDADLMVLQVCVFLHGAPDGRPEACASSVRARRP
jgi:prepilin-type N-terminal cleavage/methylation domain-containing protein